MRARSYDVIIIGAGIIGVSLALELRKQGERVIVVDKGEPGREASHASAGMLASSEVIEPPQLAALAAASAAVYPDFVSEVEAETDAKVDFRRDGAVYFTNTPQDRTPLTQADLSVLEPEAAYGPEPAYFSEEDFVDPRTLMPALIAAARRRKIEFASGSPVVSVVTDQGKTIGIRTEKTAYAGPVVVNCSGAWAAQLEMRESPVRPIKGHMLSLLPQKKDTVRHVIRSKELDAYLLPRTSGLVVVGATVEDVGFDKSVDPETVLRLHQLAADMVPILGEARIHESWAGLRPCAPDGLPIMGEGEARGYFISTGHFRNGVLLAPISARILTRMINRGEPDYDVRLFSPSRFA